MKTTKKIKNYYMVLNLLDNEYMHIQDLKFDVTENAWKLQDNYRDLFTNKKQLQHLLMMIYRLYGDRVSHFNRHQFEIITVSSNK